MCRGEEKKTRGGAETENGGVCVGVSTGPGALSKKSLKPNDDVKRKTEVSKTDVEF